MGLGILDPPGHPDSDPALRVPGTHVFWTSEVELRDTHIVLVPTPTSDPDDPLAWPLWKKEVVLAILCTESVVAATLSSILAANTFPLVFLLGVTFDQVASLTGYFLLGVGCSAWLVSGTARVYGKRHAYVLGSILLVAGSIWGARAKDYKSLLGARIMQGFGTGPFEMLVPSSIGDMYFIHQRGTRIAIQAMSLFGAAFLTPIIAGVITERMSYQWTFGWVSIFSGIMVLFVILFVPETAFDREAALKREETVRNTETPDPIESSYSQRDSAQIQQDEWYTAHQDPGWGPFFRQLRLFSGRKNPDNPFKVLLRPFPLMLHPGILWGCLTQGTLIVFIVAVSAIIGLIFGGPPNFFSVEKVGYFYTGPFLGGVIGFISAGLLSDWLCKNLTKVNNRVYEPEFRLVLVIFQLGGAAVGLFSFGISIDQHWSYYVSIMLFGFVTFALIMGATATGTYIIDAHLNMAVEAFVCITLFKNFVSFGMTLHVFDFLERLGNTKAFIVLGAVQMAICLLSVPMYIFGKYSRNYSARHDILRSLKLK